MPVQKFATKKWFEILIFTENSIESDSRFHRHCFEHSWTKRVEEKSRQSACFLSSCRGTPAGSSVIWDQADSFPRWCFIHSIYSICRVHRFRRISLVLNGYSRDPACPTTSLTCSIGSPLTFSAIWIAVTSLLSRISRGICSSRQDLWLAISCRNNFLDYRVSDTFRILVTDVETKLDDFRRIIVCSASLETKWILLLER